MHARRTLSFWLLAPLLVFACSDEEPQRPSDDYRRDVTGATPAPDGAVMSAPNGSDASTPPQPEPSCRPAQAEPEPARIREGLLDSPQQVLISATDLYEQHFLPRCGACHGVKKSDNKLWLKDASELGAELDALVARIETDTLASVMPPEEKLLRDRDPADPVVTLNRLLKAWRDAGKSEYFPDPRAALVEATPASLAAPPSLAQSLTNMGSCIPAARILHSDSQRMDELDAKFAAMTSNLDLPKSLADTDLHTLDSETLAKSGVISYAPAYTLWADDAKKMRYVRVPRGSSIAFSVAKQSFEIPDNTRFYKTFSKEVKDPAGNTVYRKMETRLIVVRRNLERPGQLPRVKAVFGTYKWNDDESAATLHDEALRNGEPFTDHLFPYVTDEQGAAEEIEKAQGGSHAEKLDRAMPILLSKRFARHYALPGAERCVQCHMGGPDGTFVLAFSPLQIMRRPLGEGGVIEPAAPDELNQLERFIRYGLITGLAEKDVAKKLLPLEKSQGARSPRTSEELIAQGYMLGNCAHCHNPKGFASLSAPELTDLLNFMPSGDVGGIFEFPLDRVSPRIQRRALGDNGAFLPIPYITTGIYDHPDTGQWPAPDSTQSRERLQIKKQFAAPWRSLIYRNVDNPFTYSADGAIFPHMPMNTPGFDCRAPRIMAEWMLSIPSLPKEDRCEYSTPDGQKLERCRTGDSKLMQPEQEVRPGDPLFWFAQEHAALQLELYRAGERIKWCADTRDIIDSRVKPPNAPNGEGRPGDIPDRPHFVPTDLTDPKGAWKPRNHNWQATLVQRPIGEIAPDEEPRKRDLKHLLTILRAKRLSPSLVKFATTPVPMGLWKAKPSCDMSSQKSVASIPEAERPSWMRDPSNGVQPSDYVYMATPGASVFGMVCSNCHGKLADSRGRQADTVVQMTGGATRVANFRAGLFGPPEMPGQNLQTEFVKGPASMGAPTDWAARYMAWMALGGTTAVIPQAVLSVVGANPVFGTAVFRGIAGGDPNMLSVARAVCAAIVEETDTFGSNHGHYFGYGTVEIEKALERQPPPRNVTAKNGDAELWERLCSFENELPVRVYDFGLEPGKSDRYQLQLTGHYRRAGYPSDTPVMTRDAKRASTLSSDNLKPWCVRAPVAADPKFDQLVVQKGIAICPPELFVLNPDVNGFLVQTHVLDAGDKVAWTLRGAVNAGFAVFSHLRDLTSGKAEVTIDYDRCELLTMSP